jgi:hypothetical protein
MTSTTPWPSDTGVLALSTQSDLRTSDFRLDPGKYLGFLEDMDLSEAQKIEVLEILWSITSTFVDIEFGVNSTSLALSTKTDSEPIKAPQPGSAGRSKP